MKKTRPVFFAVLMLSATFFISSCGDAQQNSSGGDPTAGKQARLEPGKKNYTRFCFSCHASGVAGAPRTGDAVAWAPRLEKGFDTMLESVIQGIPPGMPPRGMCLQCSDEELADVINFMLERSK